VFAGVYFRVWREVAGAQLAVHVVASVGAFGWGGFRRRRTRCLRRGEAGGSGDGVVGKKHVLTNSAARRVLVLEAVEVSATAVAVGVLSLLAVLTYRWGAMEGVVDAAECAVGVFLLAGAAEGEVVGDEDVEFRIAFAAVCRPQRLVPVDERHVGGVVVFWVGVEWKKWLDKALFSPRSEG
jgi:hypothetical protein